jgi:hypothetical protein
MTKGFVKKFQLKNGFENWVELQIPHSVYFKLKERRKNYD